ncbi:MAG: acyl-protein synthetase [Ignavibacteria bacterium]|nr:acyl-protein synthetase [Ignavibacteria bacterium]
MNQQNGTIEEILALQQYSLKAEDKKRLLLDNLYSLTRHHYENCKPYSNIINNLKLNLSEQFNSIADVPFLPVRLFKNHDLRSIPDTDVMRVLTSSGTTSQTVARIPLDRETSMLQTKALSAIVTSFIGKKRLPMLIIDSEAAIKSSASMSARGAGVIGLSNFGRNHLYALDENMKLKTDEVLAFAEKHGSDEILVFGFTFMIWQYFYLTAQQAGLNISLDKGVVIHSGGWKKLEEMKVTNEQFKAGLADRFGLRRVHNFYGMVEQVGSIYMECEQGWLHAPNYSDIIIRDWRNWETLPIGETGVVETLSILPKSYPGHSLLTEDLATVIGIDDCPCGRKGTYFKIDGRIPKAELRGCSDTHAAGV